MRLSFAVLSLFITCPAFAHALLRATTPPVGSVVHTAPKSITLNFSEGVEPGFSKITVTGPTGEAADLGDLHTEGGNARRLVLGLRPLTPGDYIVTWHAVSVDTHRTEGRYHFTIAP